MVTRSTRSRTKRIHPKLAALLAVLEPAVPANDAVCSDGAEWFAKRAEGDRAYQTADDAAAVVTCAVCGRRYTHADWERLPLTARLPDGTEWRACATAGCKNTLGRDPHEPEQLPLPQPPALGAALATFAASMSAPTVPPRTRCRQIEPHVHTGLDCEYCWELAFPAQEAR